MVLSKYVELKSAADAQMDDTDYSNYASCGDSCSDGS